MGNYHSGTFTASVAYLSGVGMTKALPVVATGLSMVLYLSVRACCRRKTPLKRTMTSNAHTLLIVATVFFMVVGIFASAIVLMHLPWFRATLTRLPTILDPIVAESDIAQAALYTIQHSDLSKLPDPDRATLLNGCSDISGVLESIALSLSIIDSYKPLFEGVLMGVWAALNGLFGLTILVMFTHGLSKLLSVRGRRGTCCKILTMSATIALVVLVFLVFLVAGIFLSMVTMTSDFCADPRASILGVTGDTADIRYYLGCNGISPTANLETDVLGIYTTLMSTVRLLDNATLPTFDHNLAQAINGTATAVMGQISIIFGASNCSTIYGIIETGIGVVCGDLYDLGVMMWILSIVAGSALVLLRHLTFKLPKSELSSALRVDDVFGKKRGRGFKLTKRVGFAIEKDATGDTNVLLPGMCYCDEPAYLELSKIGYTLGESSYRTVTEKTIVEKFVGEKPGTEFTTTQYRDPKDYLDEINKKKG